MPQGGFSASSNAAAAFEAGDFNAGGSNFTNGGINLGGNSTTMIIFGAVLLAAVWILK